MKVAWNTYGKELADEMKRAYKNYFKSLLENLQNSLPLRGIYVKYLDKNSK